jgi:glycosyltransferase involved in cell wall biosynthesis
MKLLHAAVSTNAGIGIVNQMQWEQDAARRLSLDWDVALYTSAAHLADSSIVVSTPLISSGKNIFLQLFNLIKLRIGYYRWLRSRENDYDVLVLRHSVADIFQPLFILATNRPVFLVHHTLEVPELLVGKNMAGHIAAMLEKLTGYLSLKFCAGIIGVTQEILEYEKKRSGRSNIPELLYPNGILLGEAPSVDNRTSTPEILFVASLFSPWHGLDRLLSSLKNNRDHFVLHLVGNIFPSEIEMINSDPRVVVHGRLAPEGIDALSRQCWLGLSSFALDRKLMHEACTLKVREYLANGLPVYAGYADVFPGTFKYFRKGRADLSQILKFANEFRFESRVTVITSSRNYICKEFLVRNLYLQLLQLKFNVK